MNWPWRKRRPLRAVKGSFGTIRTIEGARQSSSCVPRADLEERLLGVVASWEQSEIDCASCSQRTYHARQIRAAIVEPELPEVTIAREDYEAARDRGLSCDPVTVLAHLDAISVAAVNAVEQMRASSEAGAPAAVVVDCDCPDDEAIS